MAVFDAFQRGGDGALSIYVCSMEKITKNSQENSLTPHLTPRYSTTHVASCYTKTSIIVNSGSSSLNPRHLRGPHQNQDSCGANQTPVGSYPSPHVSTSCPPVLKPVYDDPTLNTRHFGAPHQNQDTCGANQVCRLVLL